MIRYKDTLVGKGSELGKALESGDAKKAEQVYKDTTARYASMHSKEDRAWFAMKAKE